jgi:hypothetical protein
MCVSKAIISDGRVELDHQALNTDYDNDLLLYFSVVSLLRRALTLLDYGLTLMTSFDLNYFHKEPVSKYSPSGG